MIQAPSAIGYRVLFHSLIALIPLFRGNGVYLTPHFVPHTLCPRCTSKYIHEPGMYHATSDHAYALVWTNDQNARRILKNIFSNRYVLGPLCSWMFGVPPSLILVYPTPYPVNKWTEWEMRIRTMHACMFVFSRRCCCPLIFFFVQCLFLRLRCCLAILPCAGDNHCIPPFVCSLCMWLLFCCATYSSQKFQLRFGTDGIGHGNDWSKKHQTLLFLSDQ